MKPHRTLLLALFVVAVLVGSFGGFVVSAQATASGPLAVTVPASPTDPSKPHLTYSGATITLKGIASNGGDQFRWDYGDGSAPMSWTAISDPYNLGVTHAYTGSIGDTFTATLSVRDSTNPTVVSSATYPVEIEAGSDLSDPAQLQVRSTMALDDALWYLHLHETRGTYAAGAPGYGQPYATWDASQSSNTKQSSCAAIAAFEEHGSLPTGDPTSDPYAADVQQGLNGIFRNATVANISGTLKFGQSPDANGNALAVYLGGNLTAVDAYCALAVADSKSPNLTVQTGPTNVQGRTVGAVGQDLVDWFAFGQAALSGSLNGGWGYLANSSEPVMNDTAWAVIALSALESSLSETVRTFVRTNLPLFLAHADYTLSDDFNGAWAYSDGSTSTPTASAACQGSNQGKDTSLTAGGIFAGLWDGYPTSQPSVRQALGYLYRHWGDHYAGGICVNLGDSFTMNMVARALKGVTARVTNYDYSTGQQTTSSFNWFYTPSGQTQQGYGTYLVSNQKSDGSWGDAATTSNPTGTFAYDAYFPGTAAAVTAFDASVLEEAPPLAPLADAGGPYTGDVGAPVQLDGSASTGAGLTYEWDLNHDGIFNEAYGATPTATFHAPGTYPIALRVADSWGQQSTASTTVTISAQKPVADPGGPYTAYPGTSIQLDGSGSGDPDGLSLTYAWDLSGNGLYTDSTAVKPSFSVPASARPGTSFSVCLRVSNGYKTDVACTTVTVVSPDSTPPVVTPTVDGTLGANGWYTSDVQVSWSVSDPDSAISAQSGCGATAVTADTDTTGKTLTCTATSGGGPTSVSVTIERDATLPSVNCTPPDQHSWYGTDVTVPCSASDDSSGLADTSDASFSLSTNVTSGHESNDAETGSREVCDAAGNCADAGPYGFMVDERAPTLQSCEVPDGTWHAANVTLHCTYADGGSGPASETVALTTSVPDGTEAGDAAASAGGAQACDAAGNCASAPADIAGNMIDRKAPQLSSCETPDGTWHGINVTLHCTYTDHGSGPLSQQVALKTSVSAGAETSAAVASADGAQACDAAGNCAASPSDISGNKIDRLAPQLASCGSADSSWHAANVTLHCTYADGGSGPAGQGISLTTNVGSGTENANASASAGGVVACDAVGNCGAPPPDIPGNKIDRRPPQPSSCDTPDGLWHASNVTLQCTFTDGGSGPSSQTVLLTTHVAAGMETGNASASAGLAQACDAAGNCASSPTDIAGNMVDRKAPVISCNAATFMLNQSPANVTASASDGGSGPGSKALTAPANTSTAGLKSVNFTASDNVGNAASKACPYSVGYGFAGFMSPLPKSTLQKSGSTIPVKFTLTDASGSALPPATAASLAQSGSVEATLAGPAISPQPALCTWNGIWLYFQCNVKTPSGVKTGTGNAYTITAALNLGSGFTAIPPSGSAVNPETVYFK